MTDDVRVDVEQVELRLWRQRCIQAIGAAISLQSWHGVETAYNELRDRMDRVLNKPSFHHIAAMRAIREDNERARTRREKPPSLSEEGRLQHSGKVAAGEDNVLRDAAEAVSRWVRWADGPIMSPGLDRKLHEIPGMLARSTDDTIISPRLAPGEPKLTLGMLRALSAALRQPSPATADPLPDEGVSAEEIARDPSTVTYAVQHNPNCPKPYLVRLPRGALDLKPIGKTRDFYGYGMTFEEAFLTAHRAQEVE